MTAPTIQVGDLVMWRHGGETLCEQPHWADNWNHPSTFKFATSITRDGVIVWQRRAA